MFGTEESTEASFSGYDEEQLATILAATLCRMNWTVEWSEDGEEFITIGEEE